LGVDFGGTKIEGALLDASGAIRARARTPNPGSYTAAIDAMLALAGKVEAEAGARADTIGVAMPGSLSPVTGLVRNSNSTWLNGEHFLADLGAAFARPVRVANDANCFALSEAVDGAAAGARVVFGVIVGTGCGGGLAIDGHVVEGASAIAGEWGHMPLPWPTAEEWPGPECWCGRKGCMEIWTSGSGFRRWSGVSAEEAAAAAAHGDAKAAAALDLYYDRLARGLAVVINILDPDVIVFGGGVSNIDTLCAGVRAKLTPYVFSDHIAVKLVQHQHGDSSGVRGAAWLFQPGEGR
jgi:fructokinase